MSDPGGRGREEKAVYARGSSHPAILGSRAVLAFQAGLGARLSPGRERALQVPFPAFGLLADLTVLGGRAATLGCFSFLVRAWQAAEML